MILPLPDPRPDDLEAIPVATPNQIHAHLRCLGWLLTIAMWDRDLAAVTALRARRSEWQT